MAKAAQKIVIDRQPLFDELCTALDSWDIQSVADVSGVHVTTIYHWLNGITMLPRLDTITRVADAIGLELIFVPKVTPRRLYSVK